jgi:phenylpropionate dioxygenase-like ring-hydroxylating dioxygenase large terminal subunit
MTSAAESDELKPWQLTRRWFPNHPELGPPGLDVEPFVSSEQFELERARLWPNVWVMVGRVETIPAPGNYLIKEIPTNNASLIVVRGRDNVIRAFHNVCPHRGSQICWKKSNETGSVNAFMCPYHGFTFDLKGRLIKAPDEENFYDFDKKTIGLTPVKTDVWEGFIFVHLGPQPRETLREYLGEVADRLSDYPFQDYPHFYEYRAELRCNWKVLISGFLEGYHTRALHMGARHRGVSKDNPYSHHEFVKLVGKHRLISLFRSPKMTPTKVAGIAAVRYANAAKKAGRPASASNDDRDTRYKEINKSFLIHNIFPNFQLNVVNGAWYQHQFWPLAADRVLWESRLYFAKPANASDRFFQEYSTVASRDILLEDGQASERTQGALESGAIDRLIIQDEEIAIQHFNMMVASYTRNNSAKMAAE